MYNSMTARMPLEKKGPNRGNCHDGIMHTDNVKISLKFAVADVLLDQRHAVTLRDSINCAIVGNDRGLETAGKKKVSQLRFRERRCEGIARSEKSERSGANCQFSHTNTGYVESR